MADELQTLLVRLDADIERFRRALNDAGQVTEKSTKKIEQRFTDLSRKLSGFGKTMSTFVTAPLAALAASFGKAASDAEEMEAKFNVVFGEMAADTKVWAEVTGDSIGRATQDLMAMAASVQDTFVPLGFARKEATEMSKSLTQLAIDVASFNNATDADVMRNFSSALVGNHEAVRSYGIVITEATVKQELARMGAEKFTGAALEQAKVQARLNLIMAGTSDAHGDAARTAGSSANQYKALTATYKELSVEIGKNFLPIGIKLMSWAKSVLEAFQSLSPAMQTFSLGVLGVVAAIGPLSLALGGILKAVSLVVAAWPALVAAISVITGPIGVVAAAIAGLVFIAHSFRDEIISAFKAIGTFIRDTWFRVIDETLTLLKKKFSEFVAFFAGAAAKTAETLALFIPAANDWSASLRVLQNDIEKWGEGSITVFQSTFDGAVAHADNFAGGVSQAMAKAKNAVKGFFTAAPPVPSTSTPGGSSGGPTGSATRRGAPIIALDDVPIKTAKQEIEELSDVAKDGFKEIVRSGVDGFKNLKGVVSGILDGIKAKLIDTLVDSIFGGGGGFGGFLANAGTLLGFANGGMPPVGVPSIVGERGPELFVPKTAGTIVPNHKLGGSTTVVNQSFNVQTGLPAQILAQVQNIASRAGALAAQQTMVTMRGRA